MEGFGRAIGDAISNVFSRAIDAVEGAIGEGIEAVGAVPGGWVWLVVGAVIVGLAAWRVVR